MPLNDEKAISDLIDLYDRLENEAKINNEGGSVDVEALRRFKAEETVKIFKEYILSGQVSTTVTGTDSQGGPIAGSGTGSIT